MAKQGRRATRNRLPVGWILAGVALLAGVGVAAYVSVTERPGFAPGEGTCEPNGLHEHASYMVFVKNASVSWDYPEFGFPRAGKAAGHLHLPAEHTIHLEGGDTTCTTLAKFFRDALRTRLTATELVLDGEVHQGARYATGPEGGLRFFLRSAGADWTERPDLPGHQPRDRDFILVTYAPKDAGEIAWQQSRIPVADPRERPT